MCTTLIVCLFILLCSASLPEAGEAPLQSHTSHSGRQGGHEGQSLTHEKSRPRLFTLCTRLCQTISILCQTIGWECLVTLDEAAFQALTDLTVKKTKNTTRPPTLFTRTLLSAKCAETSQSKRLDWVKRSYVVQQISQCRIRAGLVFKEEDA